MPRPRKHPWGSDPIPLRKRFGQHHLLRGEICAPLVDFLQPAGQRVVEIGPGGGVLTRRLVSAGAYVLAWEIDIPWAAKLSGQLDTTSASIVIGDATEIDWSRFPTATLVAGNLPFNVGTVLIERLLPHWQRVPRAAFLVQKEVADRLLARPGNKDYGALSVLTAARAKVSNLGRVRRGSFRPPPKVDAAFVGLELTEPLLIEKEMTRFTLTVRLAFARRRKQLCNALAAGWGRDVAVAVLAGAGIEPRRRAEELSLGDFLALHAVYIQQTRQ